jgi:hypothetical protein
MRTRKVLLVASRAKSMRLLLPQLGAAAGHAAARLLLQQLLMLPQHRAALHGAAGALRLLLAGQTVGWSRTQLPALAWQGVGAAGRQQQHQVCLCGV